MLVRVKADSTPYLNISYSRKNCKQRNSAWFLDNNYVSFTKVHEIATKLTVYNTIN